MKKKNDDHEADDDCLFEQVAFQRVDRCLDKSRSVVAGDDFNAAWQCLLNLSELLLDAVDDREGILPIAHHDDTADRLAVAVPLRRSFSKIRPETDHA